MRDKPQTLIIYVAAIVFTAALVHRFHRLGGPYFQLPQTVQDHVWPEPFWLLVAGGPMAFRKRLGGRK